LLGAPSEIKEFPVSPELLLETVKESVPARYKEQNIAAFKEGARFMMAQ